MWMKFYAYLWLRGDGTPYYAGKGCRDRAFIRKGHRVNPPKDQSRILVFHRNSEIEAIETEKELIRNWGRKDIGTGCLQNMTDGGDGGLLGYRHSAETKAKMSKSAPRHFLGQHHTAAARKVMSEKRKGIKPSPHALAASLTARKSIIVSPETRKKMSESAFRRWETRFIKTVAWG